MKKRKYVNLLAMLLAAFAFLFSFTACSDSSSSEREITDEDYRIITSILEAFDEAATTSETVSSSSTFSKTETCTSDSTVTVCLCDEDSCTVTSCECESCTAEHSSVTIYKGSYMTATVNTSSTATSVCEIDAEVDGTSYTLIIKGKSSSSSFSSTYKLNGVTITGYDEYEDALDSDDE